MSFQLEPEPLWSHDQFSVRKVVLDSKTSLAGAELGEGVIYVRSPRSLVQQTSAVDIGSRAVSEVLHLSPTVARPRYVWNPGNMVDLVNAGHAPIEILHVGFEDQPAPEEISLRDFSLIISYFLNGNWHGDFKASVQEDIQLIGKLGRVLASGRQPSAEEIRGARYARRDLNTKVRWFLKANHRSPRDRQTVVSPIVNSLAAFQFVTGKASAPEPQNGLVGVTVHTKSSSGTKSRHWRIFADPLAWKGRGSHTSTFARLSTPTHKDLLAGDYWFWAEKGKTVSDGLEYSVESSDVLDLVVD